MVIDHMEGRSYRMFSAALTREAAMGEFRPWHLLILAAAFLLLFGANKLPQLARSVGQSVRILKAETNALSGEKEPEPQSQTTQGPPATQPPQAHPHERPPPG